MVELLLGEVNVFQTAGEAYEKPLLMRDDL